MTTTTTQSHVQEEAPYANGTLDVVTGAFSYSGAAIASELGHAGRRVRTLTGHPRRQPPGSLIEASPLRFDDPVALARSLEGAVTLYNTYWIRFPQGRVTHETAVANSRTLFYAARRAGIERIVHVSITNPDISSPFPYFQGKAVVERILAEVGVPYAILRPAILFGGDGVLLNNIAWLLRHLPVFAVGGSGGYRIRPIHVEDLARLAVRAGADRDDQVIDAVGPERPSFTELVHLIREAVGSRSRVVRIPRCLLPPLASAMGVVLRDRLLTAEEFRAMADGLADTRGPATGSIAVSDWIRERGEILGLHYANELDRHFRSEDLPDCAS